MLKKKQTARFIICTVAILMLTLSGCSSGGGGGGAPAIPSGSASPSLDQATIDQNLAAALSTNVVALHDAGDGTNYNDDCVSCHGTKSSGTALDGRADAHAAMMPWTPGDTTNDKCIWCHEHIELESAIQSGSGSTSQSASLMKGYQVEKCLRCHAVGSEFELYAN